MSNSKHEICAITVRLTPAEKEQLMVQARLESRSVDKQARQLILQSLRMQNGSAVISQPVQTA